MVASSFLPVAIHNGELKFLFGKELNDDSAPGFSDFGGKVDPGENIFDAGIREFSEETTGFLGNETQLKQMVKKNGGFLQYTFGVYNVHVIKIDYDEHLVKFFNLSQKFIHDKIPKAGELKKYRIFEKSEMKWFTKKEVAESIGDFREFYREYVKELITTHFDEIHKTFFKPVPVKSNKTVRFNIGAYNTKKTKTKGKTRSKLQK
jgi:8-oxo-dGTP pyrophosphatase MutT (NUDIX family)